MKVVEFESELINGQMRIPQEVQDELKSSRTARFKVIVMPELDDFEADFKQLTVDQFFDGYDEADAMYDSLRPGG